MKKIVMIIFILFLLNYFHKINNQLKINYSISNNFDGLWFVHSKTFYENKNCQTLNITNQEYFLQIDENFKINNNYYCNRYIIKPVNKNTFVINNYYSKIIYSNLDYILLEIDKEYYLLSSMEKIEDEYEKIYIQLLCAFHGKKYKNLWQISQDNC